MRPIIWQVILAVAAVLVIICGSVLQITADESLAHKLFTRHGTYERVPQADQHHAAITCFLTNQHEPDISFLAQDEQAHLQDVRNVLDGFGSLYWAGVICFLLGLRVLWHVDRSSIRSRLMTSLAWVVGACVAVIALLALGTILDFTGLFDAMHRVLFPNGNYAFPEDSLLIRLYPEAFWQSITKTTATLIIIKAALLAGACVLAARTTGRKPARPTTNL